MTKEELKETGMIIGLYRGREGLRVKVRANPIVEAFMKNLGNGEKIPVENYGDYWKPVPGEDQLMVYDADMAALQALSENTRYRLDLPGNRLEYYYDPNGNGIGTFQVNISFLRLVGVGSGEGVSFLLKNGVGSKPGLIDLRDRLAASSKMLYSEFIRPIEAEAYIYQTATKEQFF